MKHSVSTQIITKFLTSLPSNKKLESRNVYKMNLSEAAAPLQQLKPSNRRAVCNLIACVPGSPEAYVLWHPGFGQQRRPTGLVRPFPEFDPRGKNQ